MNNLNNDHDKQKVIDMIRNSYPNERKIFFEMLFNEFDNDYDLEETIVYSDMSYNIESNPNYEDKIATKDVFKKRVKELEKELERLKGNDDK